MNCAIRSLNCPEIIMYPLPSEILLQVKDPSSRIAGNLSCLSPTPSLFQIHILFQLSSFYF